MGKYIATFWRENPQLSGGGYRTERIIEANNMKYAMKQAEEIQCHTIYGGMKLLSLEKMR